MLIAVTAAYPVRPRSPRPLQGDHHMTPCRIIGWIHRPPISFITGLRSKTPGSRLRPGETRVRQGESAPNHARGRRVRVSPSAWLAALRRPAEF